MQEAYCQNRADGLSQYESYLSAYPTSRKWQRNSVDCKAALLEANAKIMQRLEELQKPKLDYLESKREQLIQTAIDFANGTLPDNVAKKVNHIVLNKLLDKILPSKIESKNENINHDNIIINTVKPEDDED